MYKKLVTERMMFLIKYAIDTGVVENRAEFLRAIGIAPGSFSNHTSGKSGFTVENIGKAAAMTGIDINWLFGFSKSMHLKEKKIKDPLLRIKEAVSELESTRKPSARRR